MNIIHLKRMKFSKINDNLKSNCREILNHEQSMIVNIQNKHTPSLLALSMNFCLRSDVFPSDSLCNSITLPGPVKVMNKITINDSNCSFPIFMVTGIPLFGTP